jgi:hypothetical protein
MHLNIHGTEIISAPDGDRDELLSIEQLPCFVLVVLLNHSDLRQVKS